MKEDAIKQACCYYNKYSRWPTVKEMDSFFSLYRPRDRDILKNSGCNVILSGDNAEEVISYFEKLDPPIYMSYDEFLNDCKQRNEICHTPI